jgi:outer membrane usher protein
MGNSVRRPPSLRRIDASVPALALTLAMWLVVSPAGADNAVIPDTPQQLGLRGSVDSALQLQVILNGYDTRQIIAFQRDLSGRFRAKRSDLTAVGLKTGLGPADSTLSLDSIPGVSYRYNEDAQTLSVSAPETQLVPKIYSALPTAHGGAKATSGWGAALDYDVFASTASWWPGERFAMGSGSLTLDARAFSPLGVLSQSGVLGATAFTTQSALRLDTTWRYDDEDHGLTYRGGDLINAGLPWTRPLRLGGVQMQHDFGLRPDLVLGPSATVSGTAAVPTTADVFVNNFKIYSQPVEAGPFRIQDLPAIAGDGSATLVLRDVTGKATTQTVPYFLSSRLLAPGALDYSAEAGYARQNYGVSSSDYDPHLVGSASLRGGFTDWATVEAHAEGGHGLYNGGVGATFGAFQRAVVEASLAGSGYGGRFGAQFGLEVSTVLYGASFDVSTQRTLAAYSDLAEVTAPTGATSSILSNLVGTAPYSALFSSLALSTSLAPPRALDRISLTVPRVFNLLATNFSFVNQVDGDGATSRIASVGVSHNFKHGLSAFGTAFTDFAQKQDYGVVAGISYTFGGDVTASAQSTLQGRSFAQSTQAMKSAGQEAGDYGWSASDQEGLDRYVRASAVYQSAIGRATLTANQYGSGATSAAAASGRRFRADPADRRFLRDGRCRRARRHRVRGQPHNRQDQRLRPVASQRSARLSGQQDQHRPRDLAARRQYNVDRDQCAPARAKRRRGRFQGAHRRPRRRGHLERRSRQTAGDGFAGGLRRRQCDDGGL